MPATTPPPHRAPTPFGTILDVDGIGVGHVQRSGRGWRTGTTVVACADGATPGVDVRGGGPGTREIDALRPENLVETIHAVCLTGGSAYGLAAADGVMAELEQRGLGVPVADGLVVPVVPAAVIFDLGRGGDGRHRPTAEFGRRATAAALRRGRGPRWGAVGAGTGARAGGLQGGVGTASTTVRIDVPAAGATGGADAASTTTLTFTVGAVAVVNAHGSAIDPTTGLPWDRRGGGWPRPDAGARARLAAARDAARPPKLNTTIGVVATDAVLDKSAASKLAAVAHDGLARAVRPAHALVDGDTVFVLATGRRPWPGESRVAVLDALAAAAAGTFADACAHAIVAATSFGDPPAWQDLIG